MKQNPPPKTRKKSKLEVALTIDENFDFNFSKKLNPIFRWILVIPSGIISFLLSSFVFGWFFYQLSSNFSNEWVLVVIDSVNKSLKYSIMLVSVVAIMPVKNKTLAAIISSVIILGLCVSASYYTSSIGLVQLTTFQWIVSFSVLIAFQVLTFLCINMYKKEADLNSIDD